VVAALAPEVRYSGSMDSAQWRGHAVVDEDRFKSYMESRVKARVEDEEARGQFEAELRGMATTGMATEFVENLLRAVPEEKSWAVGEALAECVLADDETRETAEIIRRLSATGMTILVIEHDMAFVRDLDTRTTVLHYGRLFAQGTYSEIEANEDVHQIYLGTL